MKFIAGAVLLCLASAASAATIVGGGATLPAIGYTGVATNPATGPIAVVSGNGSLFGTYISTHTGTAVTYCATGSGAGKKILAGNVAGATVNDACPSGFGGSGLTQAHFAASDAPLALAEYNAYVAGHGASAQPTQLPAIAGAIGIAFKKSGVTSLTLTEDQICGIFSGTITDWSAISSASGPINVVYRSDNSGTSFSFLNHLSAVCPGVATHPATQFKTVQGYPTAVAFTDGSGHATSYIASYASALPTGGANGNAGVIAAVAGTPTGSAADGSIGYAEVANGVTSGVRIASVTNTAGVTVNPSTAFGPTVFPVTLTFDKAIGDSVDANGRPTLVSLPTTSNGCVALVDPSTYANPSTGYPIVAVTSLLGNAQGNGTDAATVRGLLGLAYDTTARASVSKIGRIGTGYAWLSSTDLTTTRVNTCIN